MKPIHRILTFTIAISAGLASAGGLLLPHLYRDADLYKAAWQANDAVTLILLPPFVLSFNRFASSHAARVIWLGLVGYMFYNYVFYLFGAAFNWFFLLYAFTVTSSFYTLILALFTVQSETVHTILPVRGRMWFAGFLMLTAIPLAGVELKQYVDFILSDRLPQIPVLIMALDLSLIVPSGILAAILLVMKDRWAYWLAGIMFVKSCAYGLVLVSGSLFIALKEVAPLDPLLPFYMFIMLGGLASLIALLHPAQRKIAI